MKTIITLICDNTAEKEKGLLAEHGLSILIESDETTLFDTGQGPALINNLKILKKVIYEIDRVIISHGHYDHVGGLMYLLENLGKKLPVYLNPDAFIEKVASEDTYSGHIIKSIGWQYPREKYESEGAAFRFVSNVQEISKNIISFSNINTGKEWKSFDTRLKRKMNNLIEDDPFDDDLSLLVETESGPVIILGCAHSGVIEILDTISHETGHTKFHALIGGTHLGLAPDYYIEDSINVMNKYKIEKIAPCHCTGPGVARYFAEIFKERFINISVGTELFF